MTEAPEDGRTVPDEQAELIPAEPIPSRAAPRRLTLSDPVVRAAPSDRPESWGEPSDSDDARLAHYRAQTPPHHGD